MMCQRNSEVSPFESDIRQVFSCMDLNSDGYISPEELKQCVSKLGEMVSDEEIMNMLKDADFNGDGKVDYSGRWKVILLHCSGCLFALHISNLTFDLILK